MQPFFRKVNVSSKGMCLKDMEGMKCNPKEKWLEAIYLKKLSAIVQIKEEGFFSFFFFFGKRRGII